MAVDKINVWSDPRVQKRSAHINGKTYGYLYAPAAQSPSRGTILLIHGFPDLSMGWRHQIPLFLSLGLTVLAPDCLGYGRSDAPLPLTAYTYKTIADDMAALVRQHGVKSTDEGGDGIILGGHDWGGAIVYRVAQYYPHLVRFVFSVCTPYPVPSPTYVPLPQLVKTKLPHFGYQIQFASGEVESRLQSQTEIRLFLAAMYGARGPQGETGFAPEQGALFDELDACSARDAKPSPIITARELDYYAAEYARHGLRGPLNWYRTRELNWADEWAHFYDFGKQSKVPRIEQPFLFVSATRDSTLRPEMARNMGRYIGNLTVREVQAGHWCLWQKAEEVNAILGEWLEAQVPGLGRGKSKL